MITGKDVIHFSLDDYWRSDPHARLHLTNEFWKQGNRILWINTFGMRIPKITKKGSLAKVLGKLRSYVKILRRTNARFWVFTPVALPVLGSPLLCSLQDFLLLLQIRLLMLCFRMKAPILFVSSPMFPMVISRIRRDATIYYCADDYAAYREITHKERVTLLHDMTIRLADWTFCVSENILKSVSQKTNRTSYLPHGVDFARFNSVIETETEIPSDLKSIPSPIIGYFGSLTDSNDIDLIEYLARERPGYSIVLIGRPSPHFRRLSAIANIHLLGRKRPAQIPVYGKCFDVCFMAWKASEWIQNCSPLKTLEYLALGKPVVSTPIDEIRAKFSDVIRVAEGPQDFLQKIDESIAQDSPERRTERIEFARNHTWESRFATMIEVVERNRRSRSAELPVAAR